MNRYEDEVLRPAVICKLAAYGYHCEVTTMGLHMQGYPDLLCMHRDYGQYWLELKKDRDQYMTVAQLQKFSLWHKYGTKIWICTHADQVPELFTLPPNWMHFRFKR